MKNYTHLLDDLGIAVWEFDVQNESIKCNENWATLVGYTRAELEPITTKTWSDLFHPKYLGKSEHLFKAFLEGEIEHYKCEIRLKHKEGHSVWIDVQAKITERDEDGKPVLVVGTNQDITEKKKSELKIKRFSDISTIVSNVAQTGYWEIDYITKESYCSPMIKKIYGQTEEISPKIEDFINLFSQGKDRKVIELAIKEAVVNKKDFDLEVQITTTYNTQKWVRIIGVADFKNSKCIRLYGLIQDIDVFKTINLQTNFQEEQFRQTFENATIGMALIDLDGKWLQVNESICTLLGYSKKELYGLTFNDITHPKDLNEDLKYLDELVNKKRKNYQMEKRYLRKNGEFVWANLSVSMVCDVNGKPMHFISQIEDISDNKNLIQAVQDQNKRLINFAYIVTHNLRSHTGNITMLLELMATENLELEKDEYFSHLMQASKNLTETVKHLNEVVIINSKIIENFEPLNLHKFIVNAMSNIQGIVTKTNSTIINTVSEEFYVAGIPAYLDSILLNFLTNAIKYSSPVRTPKIIISAARSNNFIVIKIKDNGMGINLERDGKHLYGMYRTFHNNVDSRGIGLFITKNQVGALGGKIEVKSEVDKGTEFSIFLPISKIKNTKANLQNDID